MHKGDLTGRNGRKTKEFTGGLGGDALLRTPCGPRRADAIRAGDLIVTRNNGLQPIRAVWKRTLTSADMKAGSGRAPVRLKPRAIGPMMPTRDLLVAYDHRIVVPGYRLSDTDDRQSCLMPAGELCDASEQVWNDRNTAGIDLYTFVFDSHQLFCASGLPVESFLPNAATIPALAAKLRQELVALFPVLGTDPGAYPATKIPQTTGAAYLGDVA